MFLLSELLWTIVQEWQCMSFLKRLYFLGVSLAGVMRNVSVSGGWQVSFTARAAVLFLVRQWQSVANSEEVSISCGLAVCP